MPSHHEQHHRRQGIDFGPLEAALDSYDYPAATTDVVEEFGEYELTVADGTRTLREVLAPLASASAGDPADLYSADDVYQAVLTAVDDGAIGRKGYSDRTPPAPGERAEFESPSI
jgi:hypothetical protein